MNEDEEKTPPGPLLIELGYNDEKAASAILGLTMPTLVTYRKTGKGPRHVTLARKIYYSRDALVEWLANGGARETDDDIAVVPRSVKAKSKAKRGVRASKVAA